MKDKERIEYCRKIIASSPGTPKARNAQYVIDSINEQHAAELQLLETIEQKLAATAALKASL